MMLIVGDEDAEASSSHKDLEALYGRIGTWWNEHAAAGRIIEGHELEPSSTATTVRIARDRSTTVTDGPFIDAKEAIGGYGVLEVADLDEALALASSWPGASTVLEIRPIVVRD
ncbi:MAG TPA: YciI family protein [Candidatus Limnocylindria bacterium]